MSSNGDFINDCCECCDTCCNNKSSHRYYHREAKSREEFDKIANDPEKREKSTGYGWGGIIVSIIMTVLSAVFTMITANMIENAEIDSVIDTFAALFALPIVALCAILAFVFALCPLATMSLGIKQRRLNKKFVGILAILFSIAGTVISMIILFTTLSGVIG